MATASTADVKGTQRVMKKLQSSLEAGDFYSAHQMYLTVCRRYVKQKKITEAVELLLTGAKLLCSHKQYTSALELGNVIFDTWSEEGVAVSDSNLEMVFELLAAFPGDTKERTELGRAALKWTSKHGEFSSGEPALHHQLGVMAYEAKQYTQAQQHFLQGNVDSAESLAVVMISRATQEMAEGTFAAGYDRVAGMGLLPVLQYLVTKRIAHAHRFFSTFTKALVELDPSLKATTVPSSVSSTNTVTVYTASVLNLAQLVLYTCQRGGMAGRGYVMLCKEYTQGKIPEGDPAAQLLEKIGEVYFQLPPRRPQQANILQDLMSSLFGGQA
ncbi:hypothetical protein RI367_001700 [Sorochytrium milnesiophthora]